MRGVNGGDKFCRFGSKVSSHQNYVTARRLPSRVSHSGRFEVFGIGLPTLSILSELQTVVGGPGEDSAADDVTGESVPDSGRVRDGGQGERLINGGDVDLSLVVGGDQDTCRTNLMIMKLFLVRTTFVISRTGSSL